MQAAAGIREISTRFPDYAALHPGYIQFLVQHRLLTWTGSPDAGRQAVIRGITSGQFPVQHHDLA
jgi:hypothetical protein